MGDRHRAEPEMEAARSGLASLMATRRSLLVKSGLVLAGVAGAGWQLFDSVPAHASSGDSVADILDVAVTAERLAVTFYSHGVIHHEELGLEDEQLDYIKAALIEEQLHEAFFVAAGGHTLNPSNTYSFPQSGETFEDLSEFIRTQQQLEGVFDAAFIAACKRFAELGQPLLAQYACQIAMVESEHRVLGRVIGRLDPADNWVFGNRQGLTDSVTAAVPVVAQAGYLSPLPGNSYEYEPVFPVGDRLRGELEQVNSSIVSRTP
jgi:hypothetical protein